MEYLFIEYPPCSTCRKAKKFLQEKNVSFESRHIVEATPTIEELTSWLTSSKVDIRKLFNTSGQVYRELQLKDKLVHMSKEEMLALLAEHGMLIKRPLFIFDHQMLVGFKEQEWEKAIA